MVSLTIRNLDESLKADLRLLAAWPGASMTALPGSMRGTCRSRIAGHI